MKDLTPRNESEKYSLFNPFNHGETTVRFKELTSSERENLIAVLKDGWGIRPDAIVAVDEGVKNTNNFKVTTGSCDSYLLKRSHIDTIGGLSLVLEIVDYCRDQAIRVVDVIPSAEGRIFQWNDGVYYLSNFIAGEHFDGSRSELNETARNLGVLHKALDNAPFRESVYSAKGILVEHGREELQGLVDRLNKKRSLNDIPIGEDDLKFILAKSEAVDVEGIARLPFQVIHYDLHPHNVLFDTEKSDFLAFLDFDLSLYSQKARDLAFSMHRFSRTFGPDTERKNDIGGDIRERAKTFLHEYSRTGNITVEEVSAIPTMIEDESLRRILLILRDYFSGQESRIFDLEKHIATLREADLFR